MNSPIQLKINLSLELQGLLQTKAGKFGVPLTQYAKHVLMNDVEEIEYPTFKMSEKTEKEIEEAMAHLDEAVDVPDVTAYFQKLRNEN